MTQEQVETQVAALIDKGGKYLTFRLQEEEYGLEILKVREIMGLLDVTSVPQMPRYVAGVINLRGKVIPVVDLRLKFGMPHEEFTVETCIIVVEVASQDGQTHIGIIVDAVSEVLDIAGEEIEPSPEFGLSASADFILGMGKVGDAVKILLDIDKVLSMEELARAAAAGAEASTESDEADVEASTESDEADATSTGQ